MSPETWRQRRVWTALSQSFSLTHPNARHTINLDVALMTYSQWMAQREVQRAVSNLRITSAYRHPHSNRPGRSDLRFRPEVANKIGHRKKSQTLDATIHVHLVYVTITTSLIHDKRLLLCPCYSTSEEPLPFLLFTFYCLAFAIVVQ